jgi:hypothetical protein
MDEFWKLFDLTLDQIDGIPETEEEEAALAEKEALEEAAFRNANCGYDAEGEQLALSESDARQLARNRNNAKIKSSGLQGDQVTPLRTLKKEERGIMIEAISLDQQENDGTPKRIYISSPIKLYKDETGLRKWLVDKLDEIKESTSMVFLKSNGWIVERFSCVHVERDSIWFKNQIPTIKNFWADVISYRNQNLALEKIGGLKETLLNKYRSIIATNSAMNIQKPKEKPKEKRRYSKKIEEETEDSEELPMGIMGGCLLDSTGAFGSFGSSGTSSRASSGTTKMKVGNVGSAGSVPGFGFGIGGNCLLADDSSTKISIPVGAPIGTPMGTPIGTPMSTPMTKKKVATQGSKKFF